MVKDIHQQWLLNCPFQKISLNEYFSVNFDECVSIPDYTFGPCIFDFSRKNNIRTVNVDELDSQMVSEDKWQSFVSSIQKEGIKELIILLTHLHNNNCIVVAFRECTLKAYIYRLKSAGILCKLAYIIEGKY